MKRKTELKEKENHQNKSNNCLNILFRQLYEIDREDVEKNHRGHPPAWGPNKVLCEKSKPRERKPSIILDGAETLPNTAVETRQNRA